MKQSQWKSARSSEKQIKVIENRSDFRSFCVCFLILPTEVKVIPEGKQRFKVKKHKKKQQLLIKAKPFCVCQVEDGSQRMMRKRKVNNRIQRGIMKWVDSCYADPIVYR